jgi:hypothetical protein
MDMFATPAKHNHTQPIDILREFCFKKFHKMPLASSVTLSWVVKNENEKADNAISDDRWAGNVKQFFNNFTQIRYRHI